MNRTIRQKKNQKAEDLNQTTNQLDLTDIHETLHSTTTTKCTFFSSACKTFPRMYHLLVHKLSLDRFLKRAIIQSIFSDPTDEVRNYSAILVVSPKELKTAFQTDIVHPSS